jgi:eukaryotic-like serine/threonine-protein kinase
VNEQVYNNRYRIEGRVGEGGMAVVYSGTDILLRRRVAIKVLRSQYAIDDDFVRRFYHEAESAARLSHPNIVNIYDVGREADAYYIVMELIDGSTLGELIAIDGKLPERIAIDYAAQICAGLAYAHRQGILHRDIKPANILITQDDVIKLSDFGIARAISERSMAMTQPGMVMGSVYYLSPEQAQGHELYEQSDLYSVGVVLYQMLTGKLPFTGTSPVTVALKHVSEPVPEEELEAANVGPAVRGIIMRLLAKAPRDRFASASEVASLLREARERPSTVYARTASPGDSPTTTIPIVAPPPRRSSSPDRPEESGRNGESTAPDVAEAGPRRPWMWPALALLLATAAFVGYIVANGVPVPFIHARTVTLGNYVGESSMQAQQSLAVLGITPKITQIESTTIPPDRVVRQTPDRGSIVATSDTIELFVSAGLPMVTIPDVRTFSKADAQRLLDQSKLRSKIVPQFGNQPQDSVIDVKPAPGMQVHQDSVVTLIVSQGKSPVAVPNLVSMNVDAAGAALDKLGLKLQIGERQTSDNIPENTVAAQDPKDGTKIPPGSVVTVVVSSGAGATAVPDVTGKSTHDAVSALQAAGFDPVFSYTVQSGSPGTVLRQVPPAGTPAKHGSGITIMVTASGVVPDTTGMILDDAKAALQNAGYVVGNLVASPEGAGGKVVRTDPVANTQLRPGETVNVIYNQAR